MFDASRSLGCQHPPVRPFPVCPDTATCYDRYAASSRMSTTTDLRTQARTLEQREQWSSALEVYEQLVAEPAPGEDLDVGLWNRIGDLHMRLGHAERAVSAYERAVQAYESAGLHNNALALCGKILRISPERFRTFLKLGLISAQKGFAADAHSQLEQFIARMSRADQLEQGLGSLLEAAKEHAADAEVVEILVDRLREYEWGDRLEVELAPLCDALAADGRDEEASYLRMVLDGIQLPRSARRGPVSSTSGLDADIRSSTAVPTLESAAPAAAEPQQVETAAKVEAADPAGLQLLEISPLDGLQSTHANGGGRALAAELADADADADAIDPLELAPISGPTDDSGDDVETEPLPLISFEPTLDPAQLEAVQIELDRADPFDDAIVLDLEDEQGEEEDEDGDAALPLIGVDTFAANGDAANGRDRNSGDLPLIDLAGELENAGSQEEEEEPEEEDLDISLPAMASTSMVPDPAQGSTDDYIDLGSLIFDDEEPATTRFVVDAEEPSGDEDQDFAEMLAQFREQVARNIDPDDESSHYDLGVAFKEMGLYDEAISEFQTALRAGSNPVATMEMLGECFIEKRQHAVAWRILDQAVRLSGAADAELVGVLYWLGRSDEALGRSDAACESYERVLTVDIRFRDTGRRLESLRR